MSYMNKQEPIYKEMRSLKPYFLVISGVYLAVTIIVAFVVKDYTLPIGAVYGTVLAVLNFLILGKSAQKAVKKRDAKAANIYMSKTYAIRYLGLFLLLTLGAIAPFINLLTSLIPLFFPRICITLRALREKD